MDNAPKAILIAAAILIVILLITFAIRIFTTTNGLSDDVSKLGSLIHTSGVDPVDIISGYDIDTRNDEGIEVNQHWYKESSTDTLLELNASYKVSFHYKIIKNTRNEPIGCGIGFNNPNLGRHTYNHDIFWICIFENYSQGAEGDFEKIFTFNDSSRGADVYKEWIKDNEGKIFIQLRLARNNNSNTGNPEERSTFKVECTNIKVKIKNNKGFFE